MGKYLLIIFVLLIIIIKLMFLMHQLNVENIRRCSEFGIQENAQKAFNENPKKFAWADRDHDKIACESLSKSK